MDLLGSSAIVETAIGLTLVFFLGAGACTAVVEVIASLFAFRAKLLWRGVARWFSTGEQVADTRRGLTKALSMLSADVGTPEARGPRRTAVWERVRSVLDGIPFLGRPPDTSSGETSAMRREFISALPGVTDEAKALKRIKTVNRDAAVTALDSVTRPTRDRDRDDEDPNQITKLLDALPADITGSAEARVRWIEQWFDDEMTRMGAAYRSRIRWYSGLVGLVLVAVMGLDAFHLTAELYREPARRQVVAASAETEAGECADAECISDVVERIDGLDVSRWTGGPGTFDRDVDVPTGTRDRLALLLGMAVTVGALAAGGPWWFSILQRLMGLRTSPRSSP